MDGERYNQLRLGGKPPSLTGPTVPRPKVNRACVHLMRLAASLINPARVFDNGHCAHRNTSEDERPLTGTTQPPLNATAGPTPGGHEPRDANQGVPAIARSRRLDGDNVTYRIALALRASGAYSDLTSWSNAARAMTFITTHSTKPFNGHRTSVRAPALVRIGVCL